MPPRSAIRRSTVVTAACVALPVILAASACGGGGGDDDEGLAEVTLTLNWVPYGEHAPFYYGLQEGIFEEEGIDLTIQPGEGSLVVAQAAGQGQVDYGWADAPSMVTASSEGVPVRSVGVFLQQNPAAVQCFSETGISEPQDLVGRDMAISPGDALSQTLPIFLAANDMHEDDIEMQHVDSAAKIPTLIEEQADCITGFGHDQAPTIEAESGRDVDVMYYIDWAPNFLGNGLLTQEERIEDNPDEVSGMLEASMRSWEAAQEDVQAAVEAMDAMAEENPDTEVMAEQLEASFELLYTENTEGERPGVNSIEDWEQTLTVLAEHTEIEAEGEPADYWEENLAQ